MQKLVSHVDLDRHDKKFLQKQLNHFLAKEVPATEGEPDCEIIMECDGPHHYLCRAHIKAGSQEWVGQDTGKSPQDAAVKAFKHLQPRRFISADSVA